MEGILLVDKAKGKTSFSLVGKLRKLTGIKKIGHAGTLDPFATGLMVMLIGKKYTRMSDHFLNHDKEYRATLHLGIATDSYDCTGTPTFHSDSIPTISEIEHALSNFQGTLHQIPPMFSAKKIQGRRLYELARQGIVLERKPAIVTVHVQILAYNYPFLELHIQCSKGTYIRSLGHDLGEKLGCGAHVNELVRLRSGPFRLEEAVSEDSLQLQSITEYLRSESCDAFS